jgi:hypothetical protein
LSDSTPAMQVQLKYIIAGKAGRTRHPDGEPIVNRFTF